MTGETPSGEGITSGLKIKLTQHRSERLLCDPASILLVTLRDVGVQSGSRIPSRPKLKVVFSGSCLAVSMTALSTG